MEPFDINTLSAETTAHLIGEAVKVLEQNSINQKRIQHDIGFHYLSQAKNLQKYRNKDPYYCYGWDRREILKKIIEVFGLRFDAEAQSLYLSNTESQNRTKVWYVFHYFSKSLKAPVSGLLTFIKPNQVRFISFNPDDEQRSIVWIGSYIHHGLYVFIDLVDEASKNLKAFVTIYTGALKLWQSYYMATFSGVHHDGTPVVGRAILEKVSGQSSGLELIKKRRDNPYVQAFVQDQTVFIKRFSPESLETLIKKLPPQYLHGTYFFCVKRQEGLHFGIIQLDPAGQALLVIEEIEHYVGNYSLHEQKLLHISLSLLDENGRRIGPPMIIHLQTQRSLDDKRIYSGILLGRNINLLPEAFPVVTVEKGLYDSLEEPLQLLNDQFEEYSGNMKANSYADMRKALDNHLPET